MDWLSITHKPQRRLDLSQVSASLTQLEAAFAAIRAARADVLTNYGADNPVSRQQVQLLTDKAKKALADAQQTIRAQFESAKADAATMRADARREFGQSADGNTYRQALIAYGQLAASMTPDQLAQQIQDATDAGLLADAKAWSALARAKFPTAGTDEHGSRANLRQALDRAADEARTPQERAADDAAQTVDVGARRFALFGATIDSRLEAVLNGADSTVYDGNFDVSNIVPGTAAEGGQ